VTEREAEPIIPPTAFSDDPDTQRLVEAMNRLGGQMLSTIDSALRLRNAPAAAQRERHKARGHLAEAATHALVALGYSRNSLKTPKTLKE